MKTIFKKIDKLTERIEMGLFTKAEAFSNLRELRSEIAEKYGEGSDDFMQCICLLVDANEIAINL